MIQRLRHLIFDNLVIKIFSLIFAVILWLHVSTRGTSEVNFMVPLELRDIPDRMAVVGNVPGLVDVRVQTRETFLRRLTARDFAAFISLDGANPGDAVYALTPSNVRAPGSVKVKSVSPSEVRLRLEKLARKTLPIRAELSGRLPQGYHIRKVEANPDSVTVEGPENLVRKLEDVRTEKIDISGISGTIEKMVPLVSPEEGDGETIKLYDDSAEVIITVSRDRQPGSRQRRKGAK
ncbi:MAG: CdaR family protein [Nitrospirota bacterium]